MIKCVILASLFVTLATCADWRIDKRDLPKLLDVSTNTLFSSFPGTLCRSTKNPTGSFLTAEPVSCTAKTPSPTTNGPFANTTCFMLDALAATVVQLKITCISDDFTTQSEQSVRVTIVDTAPSCRNMTIAISKDKETRFFLRADDPDDNNILFHIRSASLNNLAGELKYCVGCNNDDVNSPNKAENWQSYKSLVDAEAPTMHKFSKMFSYKPPLGANDTFQETLYFSARDISDLECPQDGLVKFTVANVDRPSIVAESSITAYVGRSQGFQVSGVTTAPQLNFKVKNVPSSECAVLCRYPDAARRSARDFPSTSLSGSILEPCAAANALNAEDDFTLSSATKDTFFLQSFLTVKVLKSCPNMFFTVVSLVDGVESEALKVEVKSKEISQRCVQFVKHFKPSESVTFKASEFVMSPGPFSASTLTKGSFDLQSGAAKIVATSMTSETTLVFLGTKSLNIMVMVESSNPPWTGYCSLSFLSTSEPSTPPPPPPTTSQPTNSPSTGQPTTASTAETLPDQEKPFNYTVLVFFLIVLVIVAYFFRENFFQLCAKKGQRRYGVVTTNDED